MDLLDSLNDDLMEQVLAHLGEYDLMDFAATSPPNDELVYTYMKRWHTSDELKIFGWQKAIRASGKTLPPMPGYISDDSWSMIGESYTDGSEEFLTLSRSTACAFAAASGDLDMLKCLRMHGYPWDDIVSTSGTGYLVTARAAANGHVETLEWACRNGCTPNFPSIKWLAAAGGHVEVLAHVRQNGLSRYDVAIPAIAARHGQLSVMDWFWKQTLFTSDQEFRALAIEFACEVACADFIDPASALRGMYDVFRWLQKNGCNQELLREWNRQTMARDFNKIRDRGDAMEMFAFRKAHYGRGSQFYNTSKSDLYYNSLTKHYYSGWPLYLSMRRPKPWDLI
jgi:hypothetical protein